jgi:hypothetical protein
VTIGAQDLRIIAELAVVTFAFGLVVGFIGVGGAGVAVALLTGVFGLPAHTAIGTAIAAMLFVTLTGSVSHYREGNISHRLGLVIGLAGAAGAVLAELLWGTKRRWTWSQLGPGENGRRGLGWGRRVERRRRFWGSGWRRCSSSGC